MSGHLRWEDDLYYTQQISSSSDVDYVDYPEEDDDGAVETLETFLESGSGTEAEEYSDVEHERLRRSLQCLRKRRRRPAVHERKNIQPMLAPDARCPICICPVSKKNDTVFCIASCGTVYHNTCWVQMIRWDSRCSICRFPGRCRFLDDVS